MNAEKILRAHVRKIMSESLNFLEKEEETNTKQLKDSSKSKDLGDPLDVKLNQMSKETGSDEANAPTVSVATGAAKGGNDVTTGQHKTVFSSKTKITKP